MKPAKKVRKPSVDNPKKAVTRRPAVNSAMGHYDRPEKSEKSEKSDRTKSHTDKKSVRSGRPRPRD
jgi:tRNA A-37 threonylcarbamoyl transferase component Bud32